VQTLPSQQYAPPPPAQVKPQANQSESEKTLPPVLPAPQGATREIPLPEVFRGCWRGTVARVDSITPLSSSAGRTIWLTKSYTLCYKQIGYNGKWHLTFAEGSVTDRRKVTDQRQSIRVKSVSGADRAELTAYLHFRAPVIGMFGTPTGIVNTMDELTHLHCYITPDKSTMEVEASVFVENDDRPYANINWHTQFYRTPAAASD
jgi:hypothetical protein